MYWKLEFKNKYGNTFNHLTEKYLEENDALTNLYAIMQDIRNVIDSNILKISMVEINDDLKSKNIFLIIRKNNEEPWYFDRIDNDETIDTIREKLEKYFSYLRKKEKVCNFSDVIEEDSYYLLEEIF